MPPAHSAFSPLPLLASPLPSPASPLPSPASPLPPSLVYTLTSRLSPSPASLPSNSSIFPLPTAKSEFLHSRVPRCHLNFPSLVFWQCSHTADISWAGERGKRQQASGDENGKPKEAWRSRNGRKVYFDKSGKRLSGKQAYSQSQKDKVRAVISLANTSEGASGMLFMHQLPVSFHGRLKRGHRRSCTTAN